MIFIAQFEIISLDLEQKEPHKKVTIKPNNDGDCFEFFNVDELNKFRDELRQTFEFVFPFGCQCEALGVCENPNQQ